MTAVRSLLAVTRAAVLAEQAAVWLLRAAALAAGGVLVLEIADRAGSDWLGRELAVAWAVLALLIAGAGWIRSRPAGLEVARIADERLRSGDRLATAVEFAAASGTLVELQRAEADRWARSAPRRALARPPRARWSALAVVVAVSVLGLLALLPGGLRVTHSPAAPGAQVKRAVEDLKSLEAQVVPTDPRTADEVKRVLRQAESQASQAQSPQQALGAIDRAQQQLQQMKPGGVDQRAQAAKAAGSSLETAAPTARAGAALEGGDPKGAAAELRHLGDVAAKLTPQEQKAASDALKDAADAARQDPALATPLQHASEALAQGDAQKARAALDAAARRLDSLTADQQKAAGIDSVVRSLGDVRSDLGAPGANRVGQGSGQQGAQSGRAEPGPGVAPSGSRTSHGNGQAPGERVYVPGEPNGADSGTPVPGRTPATGAGHGGGLVPYQDVIAGFRDRAQGDVERDLVPVDRRDEVRDYFEALTR
jgi:ribosomal protein S20